MAIILIDSCVITDIADPNSAWHEWSVSTLESLDQDNRFVINPMVYTETSVAYQTIEEVEHLFEILALECVDIPREALFLAGKAFLHYKKNQGQKLNVLPDFFIGAHAAVSGYLLITRDKGRFSSYFPGLELIMPSH